MFWACMGLALPGAASAAGRTYYFSDCQPGAAATCVPGNDSNSGTSEKSPKRTLASVDINKLPAGSKLLLARGGVWVQSMTYLDNPNVTAEEPLVIDAYGTGDKPWLQVPNLKASAFIFGTYNNTSYDGGYTLRNLKIDGMGTTDWGFFFIHNLHHVTLEDNEITGFHIGIHSQSRGPKGVTHIVIRNNSISRNRGMGILGSFNDTLIEGNLFEANNFSGSGFDHGTYLSGSDPHGGKNVTLRNNRYIRNSVVNGVCRGGNMTFHGQMDGVLIEGNTILQDAAAPGCWLMSITQGYASAEWFRNFVVRNNKLINGGNNALVAQSAPGIVVEGNIIINTQAMAQTALTVGGGQFQGGDVPDASAIVRNNTLCRVNAGASGSVANVNSPGASVSNNVVLSGAAASTGVCAR
jgi:Right handed beta helix region